MMNASLRADSPAPPSLEALDRLPHPPSFDRPQHRYRGDGQSIALTDLDEPDRIAISELYDFMLRVHDATEGALEGGDAEALVILERRLELDGLESAGRAARSLGTSLRASSGDTRIRRAIHDLRGGSLQALLMQLDLVRDGLGRPTDAQRIYLLARDQLKMTRNILPGIDPERHARDEAERGHRIDLLREKWSDTAYAVVGNTTNVVFQAAWEGEIAECCMEFAALDRMIYNLVNNATAHGVGEHVWIQIAPSPADPNELRVCVSNAVSTEQSAQLGDIASERDAGLSSLFEGGYTTTGHGLGLRIVAEFVVHGHGLLDVQEAIDRHYVGARVDEQVFTAWFHWPAA
jgi:signal transduction histidine kinase